MVALVAWLQANLGMVFGVLWGISESLAMIPGVKANSVFQAIYNLLKSMVGGPTSGS